MIYRISQEAAKDLSSIWQYTAENWSRDQANRYVELLINEIEYLCIKPNSGFNYNHIKIGYFRSKVKSHFIFYKFDLIKEQLQVIRILHQMMDLENQIFL